MATTKPREGDRLLAENRRALAKYEIEDRIEVGIVLVGSEVKSVRSGRIELVDGYAMVRDHELQLVNAYIAPWPFATMIRHEERRTRKLLAHRSEIDRLDGLTTQKGYTLVPLKVYLKEGRVKIELGIAKGKAQADRREDIKKREGEREARAALARRRE